MAKKFDVRQYIKELTFDRDIIYKDITFTPVKVEMYNEFYTFITCMLYDKNSIPDIKILQMSYLDYLFYIYEKGENEYVLYLLASLIALCTNVPIDEVRHYKNEKNETILVLNGVDFDKKDFLVLREIICTQNDVSLELFDLDPRVREEIQKTMELKGKDNSFTMASLEEQIICVLISTSLKQEDIEKLSIRKFKKILDRIDHKLHYQIYLTASLSGMVTFKEEIVHWMNTLEKSKLNQYISSYEETEKKVKMSNSGI